jgi:hypothetical protein
MILPMDYRVFQYVKGLHQGYSSRSIAFASSIVLHGVLMAFMLLSSSGLSGSNLGATGVISMQLIAIDARNAQSSAPNPNIQSKEPAVRPPEEVALKQFDTQLLQVDPPQLEIQQSTPTVITTDTPPRTAPLPVYYDDPYAGAAVGHFNFIKPPPPPTLSAPQAPTQLLLDDEQWLLFKRSLKNTQPRVQALSLLVKIDTQGRVVDCQFMGGNASLDMQNQAKSMLMGKMLFRFNAPPKEAVWQTLPEIIVE